MAIFECPQCHNTRSKFRDQFCPVCWLLNDFELEHAEGGHEETPQPACRSCRPRVVEYWNSSDSPRARYARELLHTRTELTSMQYHEERSVQVAEKRTETSKRTSVTMSHAACEHESTPKARAKCRSQRKKD